MQSALKSLKVKIMYSCPAFNFKTKRYEFAGKAMITEINLAHNNTI
jgi:hypothetical protein